MSTRAAMSCQHATWKKFNTHSREKKFVLLASYSSQTNYSFLCSISSLTFRTTANKLGFFCMLEVNNLPAIRSERKLYRAISYLFNTWITRKKPCSKNMSFHILTNLQPTKKSNNKINITNDISNIFNVSLGVKGWLKETNHCKLYSGRLFGSANTNKTKITSCVLFLNHDCSFVS